MFSYDNLWLISGPGSFSRERPGTPGNYQKFGPQIRTKNSDQKFGPQIRTKKSDEKVGRRSRTKKSDVGPKLLTPQALHGSESAAEGASMDIQDVIQDMFTSKDFKEDDPLKEAVYSWFDKMPEPLLIRFVEGLRAFRSRFGATDLG